MMSSGLWRTLTLSILLLYFLFPDLPSIYSASLCPGPSRKFYDLSIPFFWYFLLIVNLLVAADSQLLVMTLDNTRPYLCPYILLSCSPLYENAIWVMDYTRFNSKETAGGCP